MLRKCVKISKISSVYKDKFLGEIVFYEMWGIKKERKIEMRSNVFKAEPWYCFVTGLSLRRTLVKILKIHHHILQFHIRMMVLSFLECRFATKFYCLMRTEMYARKAGLAFVATVCKVFVQRDVANWAHFCANSTTYAFFGIDLWSQSLENGIVEHAQSLQGCQRIGRTPMVCVYICGNIIFYMLQAWSILLEFP